MFYRLIMLCFALYLPLISSPAFAQQSSLLDAPWKFQLGDNPSWAMPTFDDSPWNTIKVPSIIPQQHSKPTQGWYRVHFDANINTNSPQALLIEYIRHADETWLNGVKIGGEGHIEQPWQFTYTNPQGTTRFYPIPKGLLQANDNVLAIKVGIGFGSAWGAMFPGGAGIIDGDVYIGDIEQLRTQYEQSIIATSAADTLFLTLSLIDLLIILVLLRHTLTNPRELKWLAITSFLMLVGAAGHDLFYLMHLDINLNLLLFIALAGTPISMAMYFWAQYRNVSQRIIKVVFYIWLCAVLIILLPVFPISLKPAAWYLLTLFTIIFFLYSAVCIYTGIKHKRVGAIAQLIAFLCYLILIRTQGLPDVFLGHRNIQLGSVIYRYALLVAYFQHISHSQVHYKQLLNKFVRTVDDVRNSIARDLHDGMGQHLATIKLHSQLAIQHQQDKFLKRIPPSVDTAMNELRRIINGLRPVQLSYATISEAIQKESQQLANTYQLSIQVNTDPIALDKHQETHIFRIFQEVISNSIKHGKATAITVDMTQHQTCLQLRIQDNGQGFDTTATSTHTNETNGFGMISLSERVAILGGHISMHSCNNQGTEVLIKIPL